MRTTGISLALILILAGNAWGQTSSRAYRRYPSASNPALEYFVGTPTAPPRQAARQRVPAPRPLHLAGVSKPFSNIQRPPTISPYLSLDIAQGESSLPSYYQYVRPQLQQQQANRTQQAEILRLQQQLRSRTARGSILATSPAGGIPTTGRSSQFMNTGGYFSGGR